MSINSMSFWVSQDAFDDPSTGAASTRPLTPEPEDPFVTPKRARIINPLTPKQQIQETDYPFYQNARRTLKKIGKWKIGQGSLIHDRYTLIRRLPSKGEYGAAFVVEDLDGTTKVLKINSGKTLERQHILAQLVQELWQYSLLRRYGLPVAKHDNLEPLLRYARRLLPPSQDQDIEPWKELIRKHLVDGYYIQEYVPEPFPAPRDDVPEETDPEYSYYEQLRNFLQKAADLKIPIDASRSNVGIKNGKLVYFDLHPQGEDDPEVLPLRIVASYVKTKSSPLWDFLLAPARLPVDQLEDRRKTDEEIESAIEPRSTKKVLD